MRELVDDLPEHLRIEMLKNLPIDARVPLMAIYPEVRPKPLSEDQRKIHTELEKIYEHRVSCYRRKRELEAQSTTVSTFLAYMTKKVNPQRSLEILIDQVGDQIKFAWRAFQIKHTTEEMWTIRKTIVDLNTSEPTDDWMADSDDEFSDLF